MLKTARMTFEEIAAMNALCARIAEEKDPRRFGELVSELNDLLESEQDRLDNKRIVN
jgi:hypothetical protein